MTADATLKEVAAELGVHYMTAYRFVRLGLLPAHKDGSVWKVTRADLERFRSTPRRGAGAGAGRRRAPWAERFGSRLLDGDGRGAWGVLESALAAGMDLDELYLEVISPALVTIGERWARGEIDIPTEHRASGIVTRALGRLGPRFVRPGRTRGAVVVGTAAGERHALPVALVADLLRAAGFEVSDIGTDIPAVEFAAAAARTERLVAVGVSMTSPGTDDAVRATIEAVRSAVPGVFVLLGGSAVIDAEHADELGADGYARDGRAAVALLEGRSPGPG